MSVVGAKVVFIVVVLVVGSPVVDVVAVFVVVLVVGASVVDAVVVLVA